MNSGAVREEGSIRKNGHQAAMVASIARFA
jgi:hypothetical protein